METEYDTQIDAPIEYDEDAWVDEVELRLDKIETGQQKLEGLIRTLLRFYCSERTNSDEACRHMYA